jgi:hypothetical protein
MDTIITPGVLSTALTRNISTEICFDLTNGVRSGNGWNNGAGASRLYILQSNSVDPFADVPPNDNVNRLPLDVPLAYCDSHIDYHRGGLPFCTQLPHSPRERKGEYS